MKFLMAISLVTMSVAAFSAEDLATMKQKANANIDQRMDSLRQAKDCVNNASTMDKFKTCKSDLHNQMEKMKAQMMEEQKDEKKEGKKW